MTSTMTTAAEGATSGFLHYGMCDASAATALADGSFIVADDEHDVLQIYRPGQDQPVGHSDLSDYLTAPGGEADLEGAAALGDHIWWIGSHGRDKDGEARPARRQLFATDRQGRPLDLPPYRYLLEDLLTHPPLLPYRLDLAAQKAPKLDGALCIEGLTATPDGSLLIGFRNPVPHGWALLIALAEPEALLHGGRARLGAPIHLDLGGNGIREIAHHDGAYYIAAGPAGEGGGSALFRWSGRVAEAPRRLEVPALEDFNPEALFFDSDGMLHVLSDDGTREINGKKSKKLPRAEQAFRRIAIGADVYLA